MSYTEIDLTSFEHTNLKDRLIDFLDASGKFDDFNFEGSTINTIIDLLVHNGMYDAFLANMLANESFIQSAQIRGNVVSHGEKLSYTPRSKTASRLICDITVSPVDTDNLSNSIVLESGTPFLATIGGETFTFVNMDSYILSYDIVSQTYKVSDVTLYQGQKITNRFVYTNNSRLEIPNENCDSSTIRVVSSELYDNGINITYNKADSINQILNDDRVYFLHENSRMKSVIEFGKNRIGKEPIDGSTISIQYINVEDTFANGVKSLLAGGLIGGYSNIDINVTVESFGGSEREEIESIRFVAPNAYQAQDRGLTPTDYAGLIRSQFPFVKSVISWGGETNEPPMFGNVLLSIVSKEGELVTTGIKQQMVDYLKEKNVGSITPIIVDPEHCNINLSIEFSYDAKKTSKTFSALSVDVKTITDTYGEELRTFDQFYNEAELSRRIMKIAGVTSVSISIEVFKKFPVLRFPNPTYTFDFGNPIVKGSLQVSDFKVSATGTDHKIFDDSLGNVKVSYISNGQETVSTVGSIDYKTGKVEFVVNLIQEATTMDVYITPVNDNFYVRQRRVIDFNNVDVQLLNTVNRNS